MKVATAIKKMRFTEVKPAQEADSIATPYVQISGQNLFLRYACSTLGSSSARSSGIFEIQFEHYYAYRIGDPNDEGFYSDGVSTRNDSIYNCENFPDLDFGCFYETKGTSPDEIISLMNFRRNEQFDLKRYPDL